MATFSEITITSLGVLGGYFLVGIALHLYARYMRKVKPDEWKPYILSPDDIDKEIE